MVRCKGYRKLHRKVQVSIFHTHTHIHTLTASKGQQNKPKRIREKERIASIRNLTDGGKLPVLS